MLVRGDRGSRLETGADGAKHLPDRLRTIVDHPSVELDPLAHAAGFPCNGKGQDLTRLDPDDDRH